MRSKRRDLPPGQVIAGRNGGFRMGSCDGRSWVFFCCFQRGIAPPPKAVDYTPAAVITALITATLAVPSATLRSAAVTAGWLPCAGRPSASAFFACAAEPFRALRSWLATREALICSVGASAIGVFAWLVGKRPFYPAQRVAASLPPSRWDGIGCLCVEKFIMMRRLLRGGSKSRRRSQSRLC